MNEEYYAETGGALREMAPQYLNDLSGIVRQVYLYNPKAAGGSITHCVKGIISVEISLTFC